MTTNGAHAIAAVKRLFLHECERFSTNYCEMEKLSVAYFRYRDLLHEQGEISAQIIKIFGVLGVHSPGASINLANELKRAIGISADEPISTCNVRNRLKLWEILELFLSAVDDKATIGDFRDFLLSLDIREGLEPISTQAVNSALKTHPEIFEETSEGGQKFIMLKSRDDLLATR